MSINTRSPLRLLGGVNASGQPNDGAVQWAEGGQAVFTAYSGGLLPVGSGSTGYVSTTATGNVIIASGPGRLNHYFPHQYATSGSSPVMFYDSQTAALSGYAALAASGFKVIGIIPGYPAPVSGLFVSMLHEIQDAPYALGLGVIALSGAPGFTATYTGNNEGYVGP